MNSKSGIVFLLLCLTIWTVIYADALTLAIGNRLKRRRTQAKTKKQPTTIPPNAITQMVKNGVQPQNQQVNKFLNMMNLTGRVKLH